MPDKGLELVTTGWSASEQKSCPLVMTVSCPSRGRRQHANAAKPIENGLRLSEFGGARRYGGHNSGLERSFDGDEAVTLYKVTAAFSGIVIEGAANSDRAGGYALLCGPDARGHNATDDFIGGLQFAADDDDPSIVNLRWLYSSRQGRLSATLLPDVNPDTFYTVEAKFHYDRREADVAVDGTCFFRVDIAQTGRGDAAAATWIFRGDVGATPRLRRECSIETGARPRYAITVEYLPRPLDAIRLYNFSNCTARFREIAVSLKPGDVYSWANTAQFIQDHQHMMDALSGGSDDDSAPVF